MILIGNCGVNRSKMRILKIFSWDFSMILRSFFEGSDLGRFLWVRLLMIKITLSLILVTFFQRSIVLFYQDQPHFLFFRSNTFSPITPLQKFTITFKKLATNIKKNLSIKKSQAQTFYQSKSTPTSTSSLISRPFVV